MPRNILALSLAALCLLVPAAAASAAPLYVSIGDSYATGYMPEREGIPPGATRQGFAHQLLPLIKERKGLGKARLVNFGCGGATTQSLISGGGCPKLARALDQARYKGRSQLGAATRFIKRNRSDVVLVTVVIGGNDVTRCAREADPVNCVLGQIKPLREQVTRIAKAVRKAAGEKVTVVGLTYPDVLLGLFTSPEKAQRDLAAQSVVAFQSLINPALKAAYKSAAGRFVDVTKAFGSYTPLDQTTVTERFGELPVAAAKICELGFYCETDRDIHLRAEGYGEMAKIIDRALPKLRRP